MNPLRYRPPEAAYDAAMGEPGTERTDWEDNPSSNAIAWASATFVPSWCQVEGHWTNRLVDYLFTTCPCCMFFRGAALGILLSTVVWLSLALAVLIIIGAY